MEYKNAEQSNNENLVNEYINLLAKKVNDLSIEAVTLQARINLAVKEKDQLLKIVEKKEKDIAGIEAELLKEREAKPKEVEVIKEVIKEVPIHTDEALKRENELLKSEIQQLENKLQKKNRKQEEIVDGGGT
jgi:chromosome segregation ATPase